MKQTYLTLFLIVFIACSCSSGYKNRSIYDGISEDELRELMRTDRGEVIVHAYYNSQKALANNPEPAGQQIRYKGITYGRLAENIDLFNDSHKEAELQWDKRWLDIDARIDSIYNFWLRRIDQEGLDSYVKIELCEISKRNGSESWGYPTLESFEPSVRITPLRGRLDGCAIQFFFLGPNDDEDRYPHAWRSEWSGMQNNYHEVGAFAEPFILKKGAFIYSDVSRMLAKRKFSELTYDQCLDSIRFVSKVHSIILDGKKYQDYNLLARIIPEEILTLRREMNSAAGKDSKKFEIQYARERIAKTMIDPDYEDKLTYVYDIASSAAYKADPTAFEINYK